MVNRKRLKNPNALYLEVPGSGKSFSAKREILDVFLKTKDDILICAPEGEYHAVTLKLGGQVIKISPTSKHHINPLDINIDYTDDDPVTLKSDFILSMCGLIIDKKNGLKPTEKTIIDRCVRKVYQNYINDPRPENMPILGDLYKILLEQNDSEAEFIAKALEVYVTGSHNYFNNRTNVNIDNRLVCFDIKEIGNHIKEIGMLIIQDAVWPRVSRNRKAKHATWYYADEFHLLLKEPQTAAYSVEIWKRFRKWGGIPTALTQNVKDLLASREVESIFENSNFIYLQCQAPGDREILAKKLGISPHQLSYVTNSGAGEGLLIYDTSIITFVDRFPRGSLYDIMTTRIEETGVDV
jgi:type IV secretory pathway VirB4 component